MQILTLQLRLMLLWHFFAIGSPKADAESVRLGAKSALNPANPYLAAVKAAHCQKIE